MIHITTLKPGLLQVNDTKVWVTNDTILPYDLSKPLTISEHRALRDFLNKLKEDIHIQSTILSDTQQTNETTSIMRQPSTNQQINESTLNI
ncbi:MAG: hypothetical protein FD155_3371 [Bacteroidetes bacterium]|nr:MAG: hypothetical protein FD155_3371 [Bacteroidota bacterium]